MAQTASGGSDLHSHEKTSGCFTYPLRLSETLHTAEKHCPTMFHTATVRPRRSGPRILYNTPLIQSRIGAKKAWYVHYPEEVTMHPRMSCGAIISYSLSPAVYSS